MVSAAAAHLAAAAAPLGSATAAGAEQHTRHLTNPCRPCSAAPAALQDWSNGWRLSLGLAAVPAVILTLGGIFLPESPNSLIERGQRQQGRAVLQRIRGCDDVSAEYEDMCEAAAVAATVTQRQAWCNLFKREYRCDGA